MNVAIIGCGGMGSLHAQMAANCGHRIVLCADSVRKAAVATARNAKAMAKRCRFRKAMNVGLQ